MNYSKKTDIALWILQAFLALFFALASGAPKLFLPQDMLGMWTPLPNVFVGFIGVAEILGALGLILPGLTRIRPGLTPLAASGLVIVTLSATVYQLAGGRVGNAAFAFGLGLVVAFVAYGRWRLAPHRVPHTPENLQSPIRTASVAGQEPAIARKIS